MNEVKWPPPELGDRVLFLDAYYGRIVDLTDQDGAQVAIVQWEDGFPATSVYTDTDRLVVVPPATRATGGTP